MSNMNIYEKQYRELIANGATAWAGYGYVRAKEQQERVFSWLSIHEYLPPSGAKVLELGCGNGAMAAQYLAEHGYEVWGVDLAETAIKWAEERFQQANLTAHFIVGDVCNLPQFSDLEFDLIVDGSCLHCLIGDARQRCLAEVKRVLKPKGHFVISSMCGSPHNPEDIDCYDIEKHQLLKNGQPWRTLRPLQALLDEVREAQFTVRATKINNNPWWDHATLVCSAL